jgi:nucleoside-diphosphate-sugar epimerase
LKILVTGGAGYIGSVATNELLKLGAEVVVVDDFRYETSSLNHLMHLRNLKIVKADVRDFDNYKSEFLTSDIVIPLAALVGAPLVGLKPFESTSVNVDAVKTLINNASPNQFIIMPTTNSAYGKGDASGYCDEKSELRPISKYAVDKVELEKMLMDKGNSVSLRLATVFGSSPRMRTDLLVNDFVLRAHRDGVITLFEAHFRRNYIHIQDVASALKFCVENPDETKNETFNVGLSEANKSKMELCLDIKKHFPNLQIQEVPFAKDPDQRDYLVSNAKIEALGFTTKYSLDQGIQELAKLYSALPKYHLGNL